jgi:hypothetical protein
MDKQSFWTFGKASTVVASKGVSLPDAKLLAAAAPPSVLCFFLGGIVCKQCHARAKRTSCLKTSKLNKSFLPAIFPAVSTSCSDHQQKTSDSAKVDTAWDFSARSSTLAETAQHISTAKSCLTSASTCAANIMNLITWHDC